MLKLEYIAFGKELPQSFSKDTLNHAVECCRSLYRNLESEERFNQHRALEYAEGHLRKIPNTPPEKQLDTLGRLNRDIMYSILIGYHIRVFSSELPFFLGKEGPRAKTTLFDLCYFAGRHDFDFSTEHENINATGTNAKSLTHLTNARSIWKDITHAHERIAFRHARIANTYHLLYRLTAKDSSKKPDIALLDDTIKHLNFAKDRLVDFSDDYHNIKKMTQTLLDWLRTTDLEQHRKSAEHLLNVSLDPEVMRNERAKRLSGKLYKRGTDS